MNVGQFIQPRSSILVGELKRVSILDSGRLIKLLSDWILVHNLRWCFRLGSIAPSIQPIVELTQSDEVLEIWQQHKKG